MLGRFATTLLLHRESPRANCDGERDRSDEAATTGNTTCLQSDGEPISAEAMRHPTVAFIYKSLTNLEQLGLAQYARELCTVRDRKQDEKRQESQNLGPGKNPRADIIMTETEQEEISNRS